MHYIPGKEQDRMAQALTPSDLVPKEPRICPFEALQATHLVSDTNTVAHITHPHGELETIDGTCGSSLPVPNRRERTIEQ